MAVKAVKHEATAPPSGATAAAELTNTRPGQRVTSIRRAAALLDALATGRPGMSLAELSATLKLPKSSVLAMCNSLVDADLVARGSDGRYRLGQHLLELSRAYLAQTDLPTDFNRLCRELHVLPEQTIVLSVLDGHNAVYIGRRTGSTAGVVAYSIGMRLPANCTASGKALLSECSLEDLQRIYPDWPERSLPTLTPRSIDDLDHLFADLQASTARGYTLDDEETAPGMLCIGAPVRDETRQITAGVAVSVVKASLEPGTTSTVVREIRRLAAALSGVLGGVPEPQEATGGH